MVRSIIRQLSHQSGGIPLALMQLYNGGHERPSLTALQRTLQKIIAGFERIYLVIDALDECVKNREKLLSWIGDIVQQNVCRLHIMFSSRREQDIVHWCLESILSISSISLAGTCTNSDIERYVDAMLSKVTKWNAETRARVKIALIGGADGM